LQLVVVAKLEFVSEDLTLWNIVYKVWLRSSRDCFTASTPVYLQLTERGQLRSTKYSPWTAMHLAQRCCHCWKHSGTLPLYNESPELT